MNIDKILIDALKKQNITELTDIQKDCFDPVMEGKSIIASSNTGTGKTLAYLLPVYQYHIASKDNSLNTVIIAPTKELCMQIINQIKLLSQNAHLDLKAVAVIGGTNEKRQLEQLKTKPQIIVGTYSRIYDLIKLKKIPAHLVKFFIIDEADKMLNNDNVVGVTDLRKCFMRDIQICLFSASINAKCKKNAENLGKDFVNIFTSNRVTIPTNIDHYYILSTKRDKIETVRKAIKALNSTHCLIFANSRYDIEEITQKMKYHHYDIESLDSNKDKNARKHIIQAFSDKKLQFLVASDVASRGLHFNDLDSVINIGLPDQPLDYLHRAGRCGRNGQKAFCVSILTENELDTIKKYQKTLNINIIQKKLYQGKIVAK